MTVASSTFSSSIGNYRFKNKVEEKDLDFHSYRGNVAEWKIEDPCELCKTKLNYLFFSASLQWGDTDKFETIEVVCSKCMLNLHENLSYGNPDRFRNYCSSRGVRI